MSRSPDTSAGHTSQEKVCNDAAEAESDSGDSIFLTQRKVLAPVRSKRPRRCKLRCDPKDLEESAGGSSSSTSDGEHDKGRRKMKACTLPKYSFSFLSGRKWMPSSTLLPVPQNRSLHNVAMGGFFKCVKELWQGCMRDADVLSSLPTVDTEGDDISPLSEDEEEMLANEDFKVVKRTCFLAPSRAKRKQLKQQKKKKNVGNAAQETSQGGRYSTSHKILAKASTLGVTPSSLDVERFDDGASSCGILAQKETAKRRFTLRQKKFVSQKKTRKDEPCIDSDAAVCAPHEVQRSPGQYTQKSSEASTTATEPQTDALHTDHPSQTGHTEDEPESQSLLISDFSNYSACSETREKKKKKKKKKDRNHESIEEETAQSQEEPEGLHAAKSVNVEEEETPGLHEDNRAQPQTDALHTNHSSQTGQTEDEPESQSLLISDSSNYSACSETREKKKRKKKKKDRNHESIEEETAQSQEEPEGLHAAKSVNVEGEETPGLHEDNRAEPPATLTSDAQQFNERNCMEKSSCDNTIVRQEERDVPDSKQKKKKRKKSAAGNVRQEVDANAELDVRIEDSVLYNSSLSYGGKKKKKRKRRDEDDEQLQSSTAGEHLIDDTGIQAKKKKREKEQAIVEEREEKESSDRPSNFTPTWTGQLEESGKGLENTAETEETSESGYIKRKKHKKKRNSSNDATLNGEKGIEESFPNDAVTLEGSTGQPLKKKKKKKKKTVSNPPEENEEAEDVNITWKTEEALQDQSAEVANKKKSEKSSRNNSEHGVAQSDDSVSVRKKEKKRTSSFLVADAGEKDGQTRREQSSPSRAVDAGVWGAEEPSAGAADFHTESAETAGNVEQRVEKKKRKRKMPVEQDSVEKEQERDFKTPNNTRQSVLPESTDPGVKGKKRHVGNESGLVTPVQRLKSAADSGPTDEVTVLKKKKKKKRKKRKSSNEPCLAMHASESTAAEDIESEKSALDTCSLVSHKEKDKHLTSPVVTKGKHGHSADMSQESRPSDQAAKQTLSKSAGLELQESKTKERTKQSAVCNIISNSPVLSETADMLSTDKRAKNKHKNVKRRLLNTSEHFLTHY